MPKPVIKKPSKLPNGRYAVAVVRSDGTEHSREFETIDEAQRVISAAEAVIAWMLPEEDPPGPVTNVVGPHQDKKNNTWVLRWQEGGVNRARREQSRSVLMSFRSDLLRRAGKLEMRIKKLRGFTGTPACYHKALTQATKALNDAALDGDMSEVEGIRKYLRGLTEASAGANSLGVQLELQRALDESTKLIEDLYARRRTLSADDGTQPAIRTSLTSTLRSRTRSVQTVH